MLIVGVVGAVTFVAVFLVDGLTRRGYSPVRHPVSALALGPRGWLQTANFVVCGAAIAVGGVGALAEGVVFGIVVLVFGLALVASGAFPMDPMRGYPPGAPDGDPDTVSDRHARHDSAGAVVFVSLPVAAVVAVFTLPDAAWRVASGLIAVALAVASVAFSRAWEADSPRSGLVQRAFIITGWAWLAGALLSLT